jgi:phosphohistidine phosphatase SixA
VRWFDVDTAAARLTRPEDAAPLVALVDAHHKGRLDTRALVVVRHAAAVKRSAWHGTELDRPLTNAGTAQAASLVPVISAYGASRVVTSEWARCAATVQPYGSAAQVPVEISPLLTEHQHSASPARVARQVVDLISWAGDSVLCTHRPVLPTVVDVLAQHARRSVANAMPLGDPFLEPGEALVAHVAQTAKGPRVVAVERHQPLGDRP